MSEPNEPTLPDLLALSLQDKPSSLESSALLPDTPSLIPASPSPRGRDIPHRQLSFKMFNETSSTSPNEPCSFRTPPAFQSHLSSGPISKSLESKFFSEEDDESMSSYCNPQYIPLTPFHNQVGGHSSFLRFSEKALCKPLIPSEKAFYEKVSTDFSKLKSYVAKYLGTVNVSFPTEEWLLDSTPYLIIEENKHLLASDMDDFLREALSPQSFKSRIQRVKHTYGVLRRGSGQDASPCRGRGGSGGAVKRLEGDTTEIFHLSDDEDDSKLHASSTDMPINPWSLHLYSSHISSVSKANKTTHQFLLLEDLTYGLKLPCILDLKMGTRQYGVNSTLQKRLSQEKKCDKSTSKSLGVRICGMQVSFSCVLSYWASEVHNNQTNSFAYLDKYKGRQINASNFKNHLYSFLDNETHNHISHIPSLISKLRQLHDTISDLHTCRFYASSLLIYYDAAEQNSPIQVKMIDFAHSLTNADQLRQLVEGAENDPLSVPYPPTTKGPDAGYLLGLKSLINSFESILEDSRC